MEYTVNWDTFDQASNVGYHESWKLIGDDTGEDGDDGPAGDDAVSFTTYLVNPQRSNGNASVGRSHAWTIPWADLNEDNALGSALANDDEIRAVVTLGPLLPVTAAKESSKRVVTSP